MTNEPPVAEATDTVEENERQAEIESAEPKSLVATIAAKFSKPPASARDQKSGDRMRGAVILAAATIGCIFLFFGLFTTTIDPSKKDRKTQPSLGRPETVATAETANRSIVPQLNVTQQPNDDTGELTEKDLLGTMRNRGTRVPAEPAPKPPATKPAERLSTVNFEDPALIEAYRRQGLTPPAKRMIEPTDWKAVVAETHPAREPKAAPTAPVPNPNEALRKSSFVYVRSGAVSAPVPLSPVQQATTLLPQGTKLIARLQTSVSSAAKVPVVAVIEYNYESNGELIVPAGTKAYGVLSQATPQGFVSLKFDSLEFPVGGQEKINGSALGMDQSLLKGMVNGKNTGKRFLTRAFTGIGSIAAFAVGGRGLGGSIDNSVLLRERLSSNIALAGEQELATLAYQQNIVVTVPANTRFYIVLNDAGITKAASSVVETPPSGMTQNELQELIAVRNEMRTMNRLMQGQSSRENPAKEPEE